jgi:hypothetical protein
MFYIIQTNLFREEKHQELMDIMVRHGFEHELVTFEQFEGHNKINFITDRKENVFCFGAVKMAHLAKEHGWTPGSMMNENHDFEVYSKGFGMENMLNGDAVFMNLKDKIPFDDFLFHARPTKDTKLFSGSVFTHESWYEWVETKKGNERVVLSPRKDIQQEVRCWVVGGKVVTASRYKIGNRVIAKNYDDEVGYINFAQSMVDKYQPAKAFVIDVCLTNDEYKIVEVNCINCAGFYDANMYKLISALEECFNTTES